MNVFEPRHWIVLAVFTLLAVTGGSAQIAALPVTGHAAGPAQYSSTTYHVHGTVVDGATGKPLARALVTSSDRRLATMTNGEGAFMLDVTPAAAFAQGLRLYLNAQKPGYLPLEAPPIGFAVGDAAGAEPVQLKLLPTCVVAGHVSAEDGRPAHHAVVMLMQHTTNNGERVWNEAGIHNTGADGSFRFTNLRAGEYTVASMEWRGEQPMPDEPDAVTRQYPPMFLGDVPNLPSATKLHLHFGEIAEADLHLRLATYYPVRVPVGGVSEGFVMVAVTGGGAPSVFQLSYNPSRHSVEGSLPNGDYELLLRSFGPQMLIGKASLHVAGAPVRTAPAAMTAPPSVTVRFHRDFTGTQPPPQQILPRVSLQPTEQNLPVINNGTEPGHEDELTLTGTVPVRYRVRVAANFGYTASLRSQFSVAGTGEDGSFTLGNVVPGSYRLFACRRSPWDLAYRDPEVLRALDAKGVAVTIPPNGTVQMDAPLLDDLALEAP